MPSLSDRLQSLGVKVGTRNLPTSKLKPCPEHPIESVLPGDRWLTPHGEVFFVETKYSANFQAGKVELRPTASLEILAAWARAPQLSNLRLEQFAFIDTETTGLAGGSGTYMFLIGVGRFEGDEFRLVQFFLQDPAEETAQLAALEEFLAPCEAFVSFNGKSFDLPIINTRFITNGWPVPLPDAPHLDLLHMARRLWKARLPSRTLGDLEVKILGMQRSEEDVPGWMVPDLYFDYLHTGDARPLRGVFYHNEVDVVSMAALLNHISRIVADPLNYPIEYGLDIISIGKLYADLGHLDQAARIYQRGMEHGDLPNQAYWAAAEQLSFIHKRRGDFSAAHSLWEMAAAKGHLYAHEELAKRYEHHNKDFEKALSWTQKALEILTKDDSLRLKRIQWQEALEHRKNRLEKKLLRHSDQD
ncbi:MAG: ribonuclease H-like domain-containing protein [Anaerolineales bacterium]|nr:ribonuclease H-like domain-containing protein [Anaerolineales bacterium]